MESTSTNEQPMHPIAKYRLRHNLSQADFAEKLVRAGTQATQGLISQYERWVTWPTVERAVEIERICDGELRIEDLVKNADPVRGRDGRIVGYFVALEDGQGG